jgi:epoxyqueuosine reductase
MTPQELTTWVKDEALSLGFLSVGITDASPFYEASDRLAQWLDQGYQGEMSYLERNFEKRIDPKLLVPGTKSIISLAFNYYTDHNPTENSAYKISRYALGKDYHKIIKKKLKDLYRQLQAIQPGIEGRFFVDSAPVLERDVAVRAGMGWRGKNTLLIHPKMGSYFFLAEIFINQVLVYDEPMDDYCGTCTKCIDHCPTEAIEKTGYQMNASHCISYLTIELKENRPIPEKFKGLMENYIFGCDICQEVCPWNRFSKPHNEDAFLPSEQLKAMKNEDWENLTQEKFNSLFEGSAVKRTKFGGLKRNINFLQP